MPEYLSPGVYVEEIDVGPVPIEGVSTSTAGFVGMTAQGPTDGLPVLVTSFGEFVRTFGGYLPASLNDKQYLPYAVQGFFDNGGQRVYIKRVVSSTAAAAASTNLKGGLITRLSRDVSAGNTQVQLSTLRGIQADTTPPPPPPAPPAAPGAPPPPPAPPAPAGHPGTTLTFTQVKNGITTTEQGVVKSYDDSTKTVTLKANLQNSYEARYTTVTTDISPGATTPIIIRAISQGAWANAEANTLVIQVFHTSKGRAQVQQLVESTPGSGNFDTVVLNSASSFYPGAIVEFNNGKTKTWGKVSKVAGTSIVLKTPLKNANALDVDASMDKTKFPATIASTCEFRLTAASMGVTEDYPILTLDDTTPYYFGKLVNNISKLITISGSDNATETPFTMPSAKDGLNVIMGGGLDGGEPTYNDYIGQDNGPGMRTGLKALEDIEQISIIAAPGITDQSVQNELINQCERLRYRFAILDPLYGTTTPLDDVENQRQLYDTHYAALYFPNVVISNPDPASPAGSTIVMPPSGHMAGIYARTDIERGVYKAPANEVILGITDLDLNITKGEQDILNPPPYQINVLRNFRHQGRGLRVWGARCITGDAQWKYVNVRRLFIFVEASLDQGTQWVVFEPNDYPLWDRVKQSISNFLTSVWRDGALMGTKVEEAFFVRVGRSTMTQDDIDNGRLIILVGIAPVKPAEFVIIRISQFTASASTTGQ